MPDGIPSIAAANSWHELHDRIWTEEPPPNNPEFVNAWFLRCQELMDKYQPDLIYFDNDDLPLGQAGLDVTAHFYNSSIARNGSLQCVVNGKNLKPDHTGAITLDIERGRAKDILADPWQTDTCIGDWHYKRSIFENHTYKTPRTVIHTLIDVVSKNGNLLLSIPVRGNGAIDEDEHAFLQALATWLPVHGEAIYGTRPFTIFGEGAQDLTDNKGFSEDKQRPYTSADIRFTTKGPNLYAFALGWPGDEATAEGKPNTLTIRTLARSNPHLPKPIQRIDLLGASTPLRFTQTPEALTVTLPRKNPTPMPTPSASPPDIGNSLRHHAWLSWSSKTQSCHSEERSDVGSRRTPYSPMPPLSATASQRPPSWPGGTLSRGSHGQPPTQPKTPPAPIQLQSTRHLTRAHPCPNHPK